MTVSSEILKVIQEELRRIEQPAVKQPYVNPNVWPNEIEREQDRLMRDYLKRKGLVKED